MIQKYWGIGLNKTGTCTLEKVMQKCGFSTRRYQRKDFHYDNYQFLCDLPVMGIYKRLDKKYNGSKFIYTIRDLDSWLKSCQCHWHLMEPLDNAKRAFLKKLMRVYRTTHFDAHKFAVAYVKHDISVRSYFKDRPDDLLIINICAGEDLDGIFSFVGKEGVKLYKIHKNSTKYDREEFKNLPPISYDIEQVMSEVNNCDGFKQVGQ